MSSQLSWCNYKILGPKIDFRVKSLNEAWTPYKASKFKLAQALKSTTPVQIAWDWPRLLDKEYPVRPQHWDLSHCMTDHGLLLGLRILKKNVPAKIAQYLLKNKLDQVVATKGKISPTLKKRIKEEIHTEVLSYTIPAMTFCQGYWNSKSNSIKVLSTSNSQIKSFLDLFADTFLTEDHELVESTPGSLAFDLEQSTKISKLDSILPWGFEEIRLNNI